MESASTAAVLLQNLPPSALAGIDLLSFTTTPRFQGIKDVPRGFHFIFTGQTSAFSIRHGAWFHIVQPTASASGADLVVKKWDAAAESLLPEPSATETLRQRANLGSIWRDGLTPYRQTVTSKNAADDDAELDSAHDWLPLTSAITPALLTRVLGPDWALTSAASALCDRDDIPGLPSGAARPLQQAETELRFLPIDLKQTWAPGAMGRARTDAARDRSWYLNALCAAHCSCGNDDDGGWDEALGELQLCFVMVLTLNNYSCLEQWRRILEVVLTCVSGVDGRAEFFVRAVATLRLQLVHCQDAEGGLFDFEDEGGSWLKALLVRFRRGVEGSAGEERQDVLDELDDLQAYLKETHGWRMEDDSFARSGMLELEDGEQVEMDVTAYDEDDEQGEYAPQVVDLSPEQLRMLGGEQVAVTTQHSPLPRRLRKEETPNAQDIPTDDEDGLEDEESLDLEDMDARY